MNINDQSINRYMNINDAVKYEFAESSLILCVICFSN